MKSGSLLTTVLVLAMLLQTFAISRAEEARPGGRIQYPKPEPSPEGPVSEKNRANEDVKMLKKRLQESGFFKALPPDYRKVYVLLYMQEYASPALDRLGVSIEKKDKKGIREAAETLYAVSTQLQVAPVGNESKWFHFSQRGKAAVSDIRALTYRDDSQKLIEENFAKLVESCYACHRVYGGPPDKYEELTRFRQREKPLGPVPEVPRKDDTP